MIQNIYLVFRNIFRKNPYYLHFSHSSCIHWEQGNWQWAQKVHGRQPNSHRSCKWNLGKFLQDTMDFIVHKEDVHLLNHKQSCCSPGVLHNLVTAMVGRVVCNFAAIVELAPLTHLQFTRGRRHFPSSERCFTCAGSPRGDLFSWTLISNSLLFPVSSELSVVSTLLQPQPGSHEHLDHIMLPCKIRERERVGG